MSKVGATAEGTRSWRPKGEDSLVYHEGLRNLIAWQAPGSWETVLAFLGSLLTKLGKEFHIPPRVLTQIFHALFRSHFAAKNERRSNVRLNTKSVRTYPLTAFESSPEH